MKILDTKIVVFMKKVGLIFNVLPNTTFEFKQI